MLRDVYRDTRGRVAELVAGLDDARLRTRVPATPEWTVRDLLAHLVGVAADTAAGRLDGAPGADWTARHVAERRNRTVADLLAEWASAGSTVEGSITDDASRPNMALDVVCHEADLREALTLPPPAREHWQQVLDVMVGFLGRRLKQPGTLTIGDDSGARWRFGTGEPRTSLQVDGYELLRGMFSRRSQRQIAAWRWQPAPPERVQRVGVFGPRDDDQPVPTR